MSLRAVKPPHETGTGILDAAEELFMLHGLEGTSMRLLTSRAGVNLAAVNYHFGSKDALIEALFRRKLDPMNTARIAELERLETEAKRRPPVSGGRALQAQAIIPAFLGPSPPPMGDPKGGGPNFTPLPRPPPPNPPHPNPPR